MNNDIKPVGNFGPSAGTGSSIGSPAAADLAPEPVAPGEPFSSGSGDSASGIGGSASGSGGVPVDSVSAGEPEQPPPPKRKTPLSRRRAVGLSLISAALVAGGALAFYSAQLAKKEQASAALASGQRVKTQSVPLPSVVNQLHVTTGAGTKTLTVNGQANITDSLVLEPSAAPATPATGQLYYDSKTNVLSYYNGTRFVPLAGGNTLINNITNIAGPTNITNVAGNTTINNITNNVSGADGSAGIAGQIAMFTAANVLGNSLIYQAGSNLDTGAGVENATWGSLAGTSATSVQGGTGGLNLLTGGAFAVNAGSGSLTTSSGALNITAGASSNWQIAAASSGNGGNLSVAAGGAAAGNNNGGSLTLQAGASTGTGTPGDVNVSTPANALGPTGNINIQSGDSSTTAAGNINIDAGNSVINGTQVGAKDFETGTENMCDSIFGDNSIISQTNAQAHAGTHSLSVAVGSNFFPSWGTGSCAPFQEIPVTQGHTYAFSAWVRAATHSDNVTANVEWSNDGFLGGGLVSEVSFGNATDITTGWKHIAGVLTAPATSSYVGLHFFGFGAASIGEVHYIDDITVTDLSGGAMATINLGVTNAQLINIGNTGMLGATSITGSGINLAADAGILNLAGATITATSGGATYTTTSGALDITAATSSTWKINGGLFGGALTIASGNAGGNNNGGNLVLQSGSGSGTGISGSITLDALPGSVSGTLVDNRGFETGTQNMLGSLNDTVAQSNVAVHSGSFSLSETSTVAGNWAVTQDQTAAGAPVIAGHKYFFSAYVRANSTTQTVGSTITWLGHGSLTLNSVTEVSSNWSQISGIGTAPAGTTDAYWNFSGTDAGGVQNYFDDLTVTDLSASAGTTNINIGTSGAQAINLGNLNQVGSTTIQGGAGIQINSGGSTLNLTGNVVAKPQTDSAGAFVIQNQAGTALLTADTSAMTITVKTLIVTADLTVNGHIITGGTAPGIAAGPAACTTPTVSLAGTDTSGTITITTGSGCAAAGKLATVTFSNQFGAAPHVTLTPGGSNAQTLGAYVDDGTISITTFDLDSATTPANATTYKWNYWVAQ